MTAATARRAKHAEKNLFGKPKVTFSSKLSKQAFDLGQHGTGSDKTLDAWLERKAKIDDLSSSIKSQLRRDYWRGVDEKAESRERKADVPPAHAGGKEKATEYKGQTITQSDGKFRVLNSDWSSLKDAKEYVDYHVASGGRVRTKNAKGPIEKAIRSAAKLTDKLTSKGPVGDFLKTAKKTGRSIDRGIGKLGKKNPAAGAAAMREAWTGRKSNEEIVIKTEEHYHEHVAGLGICCGVVVETIFGKTVAIGLSGYEFDARAESPVKSLKGAFTIEDVNAEETLGTSNEDGTQIFFDGGNMALELGELGFEGPAAQKESIIIGDVTHIAYDEAKVYDGEEEDAQWVHEFSEDTKGPLPMLRYDRINEQLYLDGGVYHIEKPLFETSPGIED